MAKNEVRATENNKVPRELSGLFLLLCAILLGLSLATWHPADPSINHVVTGKVLIQNKAGAFGAYLSGLLVDFFGIASFALPLVFLCLGIGRVLALKPWPWWRWWGFLFFCLCVSVTASAWATPLFRITGGGFTGNALRSFSVSWLGSVGTGLVWGFIFLLSVQAICGFSWLSLLGRGIAGLRESFKVFFKQVTDGSARKPEESKDAEPDLPRKPLFRRGPRMAGGSEAVRDLVRPPAVEQASQAMIEQVEPGQDPFAPQGDGSFLSGATEPDPFDPPWLQDLENGSIAPRAVRDGSGKAGPAESSLRQGTEERLAPEALPTHPHGGQEEARPRSGHDIPASGGSVHVPSGLTGQGPQQESQPGVTDLEDDDTPLADITFTPAAQTEFADDPEAGRRKRAPIPLPPLSLLHSVSTGADATPRSVLEARGRSVMTCLSDFGIQGELVGIAPGPVVTMFEVKPAPGVKVSRIANLSDDLALAMKAIAVRIQAPIPGTDTVGIEVPNDQRETVCLKELFSSKAFAEGESLLTMALGKDISGHSAVADLARMPHLLVAGATGAGKSVCLNSILLSFLYKARPDQVKMLLVDPKRIEMAVYADLPHLVHPVVTEMALAKNALDWAVAEMDRRYTEIARLGVRNIAAFNAKLADMGSRRPPELADLEEMPYLVIVIDELADLMLTAAKEVEVSIVRLAQLARAAGIHMILATQRPSVDVVTGLIKANFPCRISFQVTSKHDSRTILDAVGAENLLGKGDMLFKPAGGRFQRLHGAFVSDDDVAAVADYWRSMQKPDYRVDFAEMAAETGGNGEGGGGSSDVASDPVYAEAVDFVCQQGKASISLIQRRFRIGFNRAARFVEQMEADGLIGPADGSKPRLVIR